MLGEGHKTMQNFSFGGQCSRASWRYLPAVQTFALTNNLLIGVHFNATESTYYAVLNSYLKAIIQEDTQKLYKDNKYHLLEATPMEVSKFLSKRDQRQRPSLLWKAMTLSMGPAPGIETTSRRDSLNDST